MSEISKIILGGAQLGFNYVPEEDETVSIEEKAFEILNAANQLSIYRVDTARAYGSSEENIGSFCKHSETSLIIDTKLSSNIELSLPIIEQQRKVEQELMISMKNLYPCKIDVFYFHNFEQFVANNFLIAKYLKKFEGVRFQKLGVSVYSVDEAKIALQSNLVNTLQIPFNILNSEWNEILSKYPKVHFVARSIFLQGLLLNKDSKRWDKTEVTNKQEIFKWLELLLSKFKVNQFHELLISYVLSKYNFYGIILGFNSKLELESILRDLMLKKLTQNQLSYIDKTRPLISKKILDPRKWNE